MSRNRRGLLPGEIASPSPERIQGKERVLRPKFRISLIEIAMCFSALIVAGLAILVIIRPLMG